MMRTTSNSTQPPEKLQGLWAEAQADLAKQVEPIIRAELVGANNGGWIIETPSPTDLEILERRQVLIEQRLGGPPVQFVLSEPELAEPGEPARPRKLKRVVIKEELVELLGDHLLALILNQFLYWSERTGDVDKYLKEERRRDPEQALPELTHGWIYKSGEELSEELMIGSSRATMRRHLKKLVEAGYLAQRSNPRYKWDKTLQYRPDLLKIQADLQELGYALEGYKLPEQNPVSK